MYKVMETFEIQPPFDIFVWLHSCRKAIVKND